MTPFAIPITCPTCAGPLTLVNARAQRDGLLSVAILECPACRREWEVTARMVPHGPSVAGVDRTEAVRRAAKARKARQRQRERDLVTA